MLRARCPSPSETVSGSVGVQAGQGRARMQVAQDAGHTSWQEHPSLPGKEPWALAPLPSTVPHTRQVVLGASRNPLSPMVRVPASGPLSIAHQSFSFTSGEAPDPQLSKALSHTSGCATTIVESDAEQPGGHRRGCLCGSSNALARRQLLPVHSFGKHGGLGAGGKGGGREEGRRLPNTRDPLYMHHTSLLSGQGDGNPLPYSCLRNPTDRGAWWAIVHAVTKSWTRLSN